MMRAASAGEKSSLPWAFWAPDSPCCWAIPSDRPSSSKTPTNAARNHLVRTGPPPVGRAWRPAAAVARRFNCGREGIRLTQLSVDPKAVLRRVVFEPLRRFAVCIPHAVEPAPAESRADASLHGHYGLDSRAWYWCQHGDLQRDRRRAAEAAAVSTL